MYCILCFIFNLSFSLDCSCNIFGILNNNQICDQYTGQCQCKRTMEGRKCDTCKDGFYKFPVSVERECEPCPCNKGGSLSLCNKITGNTTNFLYDCFQKATKYYYHLLYILLLETWGDHNDSLNSNFVMLSPFLYLAKEAQSFLRLTSYNSMLRCFLISVCNFVN